MKILIQKLQQLLDGTTDRVRRQEIKSDLIKLKSNNKDYWTLFLKEKYQNIL